MKAFFKKLFVALAITAVFAFLTGNGALIDGFLENQNEKSKLVVYHAPIATHSLGQ